MTDTPNTTAAPAANPLTTWLASWFASVPKDMPSWGTIAKSAAWLALGLAVLAVGWWAFTPPPPVVEKAAVTVATESAQTQIDLAALIASNNRIEEASATSSREVAAVVTAIEKLNANLAGLAAQSDVAELTAAVKQLGIGVSMAVDQKAKPPSPARLNTGGNPNKRQK